MTGSEIKTFVEAIYDDTIDDDLFLNLLNLAKDEIEEDKDWEILKAIDSSKTSSPSDTYLTMKELPADFRRPIMELYVGRNMNAPYLPIPFEKRELYANSSNLFYIDYKNSQFAIIGSPSSAQTIYLPYIVTTDELTLTNSWGFPSRFHKLLALLVVTFIESGVDVDDIYARMSQENRLQADMLRKAMNKWNARLAYHANGNSSSQPNVDLTNNLIPTNLGNL